MAKKILLYADYPVRGALMAVLEGLAEVAFVADPGEAEVVIAYSRRMVLRALKTKLPVWQISHRGGGVKNKRVRHFNILVDEPNLIEALKCTP